MESDLANADLRFDLVITKAQEKFWEFIAENYPEIKSRPPEDNSQIGICLNIDMSHAVSDWIKDSGTPIQAITLVPVAYLNQQ